MKEVQFPGLQDLFPCSSVSHCWPPVHSNSPVGDPLSKISSPPSSQGPQHRHFIGFSVSQKHGQLSPQVLLGKGPLFPNLSIATPLSSKNISTSFLHGTGHVISTLSYGLPYPGYVAPSHSSFS